MSLVHSNVSPSHQGLIIVDCNGPKSLRDDSEESVSFHPIARWVVVVVPVG